MTRTQFSLTIVGIIVFIFLLDEYAIHLWRRTNPGHPFSHIQPGIYPLDQWDGTINDDDISPNRYRRRDVAG